MFAHSDIGCQQIARKSRKLPADRRAAFENPAAGAD
jgi:hypothetical protein